MRYAYSINAADDFNAVVDLAVAENSEGSRQVKSPTFRDIREGRGIFN
jgi:hypothetical protein